jgi:hypothetical protein
MAFLCHHRIEFMPSPQCKLQLQNNIYAMQNTCHSKESNSNLPFLFEIK